MSSYSDSSSETYTEARARYVMGKIFDDFHAMQYRGFSFLDQRPDWLQKMREDIFYLMTKKVLRSFQVQFFADQKEWAVEYTIKADGSIYQDDDSGGIDYYDIPARATMDVVVDWKHGTKAVDDEMIHRGWTGKAAYFKGDLTDDGAYSKSGYGVTKGRRGSWTH